MTKIKEYQIFHTSKLFHKKYPYKVTLSVLGKLSSMDGDLGWQLRNCKEWFATHKITDYRIYNKTRVLYKGSLAIPGRFSKKKISCSNFIMSASVFLKTKSNFNAFVKQYKSNINSITIPINNTHVSILENDRSIVVRKTLLYKKYRYVIKFKHYYSYNWFNNATSETDRSAWIEKFVNDNEDCKWIRHDKNLYFNGEDNLMLIKLSFGDEIKRITEIRTFDEVKNIQ